LPARDDSVVRTRGSSQRRARSPTHSTSTSTTPAASRSTATETCSWPFTEERARGLHRGRQARPDPERGAELAPVRCRRRSWRNDLRDQFGEERVDVFDSAGKETHFICTCAHPL